MNTESEQRYESVDLSALKRSLPANHYFNPGIYQEELLKIWYREWLYVCRDTALRNNGDYYRYNLGTQSVIVLRDEEGQLRAFHNTCPHRGSMLCEGQTGNFRTGRITCPYHRWTYSLAGKLIGVPYLDTGGTEQGISLFSVSVREWHGYVFINLVNSDTPEFGAEADPGLDVLQNWPLSQLGVGHQHTYQLACNWKVFWENFVECYHCPGTHPGLCQTVPLYRRSYTWVTDKLAAAGVESGNAENVASWTSDGKTHWSVFPTLTEEERTCGYTFLTLFPTVFIVAHSDYVRQVSIRPLGPGQTEVRTEWMFDNDTIQKPGFDPAPAVDFVMQVLKEDARVCELNQRGLQSLAFDRGNLVPQEQEVYHFHEWYRKRM